MKKVKKLFAVIFAAIMVMAMAVPALATEVTDTPTEYTVKITAPDASADHQFKVYQIFTGTNSSENTLTDVDWSENINNSVALITALKSLQLDDGSIPFANMTQNSAASVADILSGNVNNTSLIEKFIGVITDKGENGSYTYISSPDSATPGDNGQYTVEVPAGYYVIVDEAATNAAHLMLEVVGPEQTLDVTAKMEIPSVKKYAGEETVTDNANYSVGDEIPYTLVGTMPNYDPDGYSYTFMDTMDEALDLIYTGSAANPKQVESGVAVTIGNAENATDITPYFDITYDNHVLTIASKDTLTSVGELSMNSVIYVSYIAKANSTIEAATDIENKVVLKSVVGEKETTTPEVTEQVYPITLKITKVNENDEAFDAENPASFQLYRTKTEGDDTVTEYATTTDDGKTFAGWTTDENSAATLTTDERGQISFVGIGAGTFYLKETAAPSGYNKLTKDIKIVIQSTSKTSDTGTVELETLKYSTDGGQLTSVSNADLADGTVSIDVQNNKGATLPTTGGIGTTIFYIIGAILVVGAVVILITRRRVNAQ